MAGSRTKGACPRCGSKRGLSKQGFCKSKQECYARALGPLGKKSFVGFDPDAAYWKAEKGR